MREIIKQIVEDNGFVLYDIENVLENDHRFFRVYIQHPKKKSVTLDDCALINQILSPIFDVEYNVDEQYFLEVSSPGVERVLKEPHHFEKSVGELVRVTLNDGQKIKGKLQDFDKENNKINIKNKIIPLSSIKKAKTYFEW
ncbi:MAG: ribosome maturation factor RimP [Epsilonproteobacteria bacterium]|nr:ribosome maturation factor RimP [Campylobacterota bacterium]